MFSILDPCLGYPFVRTQGIVEKVAVVFFDSNQTPVERFVFKLNVNQNFAASLPVNDIEYSLRTFLIKLSVSEPLLRPLPQGLLPGSPLVQNFACGHSLSLHHRMSFVRAILSSLHTLSPTLGNGSEANLRRHFLTSVCILHGCSFGGRPPTSIISNNAVITAGCQFCRVSCDCV